MSVKKCKIVFVNSASGDWEGLYVDGKLIYEGHTIPRDLLMENAAKIGAEFNYYNDVGHINLKTDIAEIEGGLRTLLSDYSKKDIASDYRHNKTKG